MKKESDKKTNNLKDFVEYIPDAVFIHDLEGNIRVVNNASCFQTGYTREELLKMSVAEIDTGVLERGDKKQIWQLLNPAVSKKIEVVHKRKNGTTYFAEVIIKPFFYEDQNLVFAIARDISKWRQAEEKVSYTQKFKNIILELSQKFTNVRSSEFDKLVLNSLETIGKFCGTDRSYVFIIDNENGTTSNTHEWSIEGISPQKENLQNLPVSMTPNWFAQINKYQIIDIPDVIKLPEEWHSEKEILSAQNIKSILAVPLVFSNALIGFVGFDQVKNKRNWLEEEIKLLKIFAGILASAIEKHRMDDELLESEKRFRMIIENANEGFWAMDQDYRTTFVNNRMANMLGYSSNEMLGKKVYEFILESEMADHNQKMNERITGQSGNYDRKFKCKDGTVIDVHISSVALFDDKNKYSGAFGMFTNITEFKKIQNELLQNSRQFELLSHTSLDGFWITDLSGNLLDVNDSYCRFSGYSREELLKMNINDLEANETAEQTKEHIKQLISTGYERFQTRHKVKNGDIIDLEVSTTYFKEKGIIMVFLSDITKRKRIENELKQQLLEINRFNKLMVGRELKMIELKQEINDLLIKMGKTPKYQFAEES